jgi:cell division initiation protein
MDNFNQAQMGYDKKEVNEFVDYVIKKTEENIDTIKSQNEEIKRLNLELEKYKKMESTYQYLNSQTEYTTTEIKRLAEQQADLIVKEAKDNASRIVNDALIKAQKIQNDKELLNKNIVICKKKIRNALMEQLDLIEEIEML